MKCGGVVSDIEGVRSKRAFFEFRPSVRIKRAFQMPMNCSFPLLVKCYLKYSANYLNIIFSLKLYL